MSTHLYGKAAIGSWSSIFRTKSENPCSFLAVPLADYGGGLVGTATDMAALIPLYKATCPKQCSVHKDTTPEQSVCLRVYET